MSKVMEQIIAEAQRNRQIPDFRVGDMVRVYQTVPDFKKAGDKKLSKTAKAIKRAEAEEGAGSGVRSQVFEGTVIARKHGREPGASFTVRRIASGGVGVEKIYPLYSPLISKIEIASRPTKRVRRAKLYFLRGRTGKAAQRLGVGEMVEKSQPDTTIRTESEEAAREETKQEAKN